MIFQIVHLSPGNKSYLEKTSFLAKDDWQGSLAVVACPVQSHSKSTATVLRKSLATCALDYGTLMTGVIEKFETVHYTRKFVLPESAADACVLDVRAQEMLQHLGTSALNGAVPERRTSREEQIAVRWLCDNSVLVPSAW